MTNKRPNILIFNPDQWRGDMLGYLGYPGAKHQTWIILLIMMQLHLKTHSAKLLFVRQVVALL